VEEHFYDAYLTEQHWALTIVVVGYVLINYFLVKAVSNFYQICPSALDF